MDWTVYMLRCADGTLYTGITNDMDHRLANHVKGTGAKYTKGRAPFEVVFIELYPTKGLALKREAGIKSLTRKQKLALTIG